MKRHSKSLTRKSDVIADAVDGVKWVDRTMECPQCKCSWLLVDEQALECPRCGWWEFHFGRKGVVK